MKTKRLLVVLDERTYWKYKNKCQFYDLGVQAVALNLFERFINGEFDKDFDIPEDDYFTKYHELLEKESEEKYDNRNKIKE